MPDTITISSGSRILSTGTSDFYLVKGSGLLIVSSGGSFLSSRPEISAYGTIRISAGGKANPFVGSGGTMEVYSKGYVSDVRISGAGTAFLYKSATCSGLTVSSGGTIVVRGGNLYSATVNSASLTLDYLAYPDYSYAANTTLGGNTVMTLQNGAKAFITMITGTAKLDIQHGGYASSNTVSSGGGTLNVFGSAVDNTVRNGAYMFVNSGGRAEKNYVSYGGLLRIYDAGYASSNYVSNGGVMDVFSGGSATDTTVYSGGSLYVGGKALVYQTVLSGGSVTLYGRSENGVYSAGIVTISSGASSYAETFCCSAIVEGVAGSSGTVERATLGVGATVQVSGGRLEGKTVANATVNLMSGYVGLSSVGGLVAMVRNGAFWVSSGAMNSAYVNDGGKLYMMQRATANLVSVSSGGHCGIASGCIVSNANVGALAGSNRGTLGISSGGQLIKGNISGTVEVGFGGRATQLTIAYGGSAIVNGIVDSTVVSSGTLDVSSGGTVSSATLRKGNLNVYGTVSSANLESSAGMFILGGGVVKSGTVCGSATISKNAKGSGLLIVSGGSLSVLGAVTNLQTGNGIAQINSGGTLSGGTVSSGGTVTVNGNATAFSCTVGNGGVMKISSGAAIANFNVKNGGKVTGYYNCGNVTFSSGANADISIFNLSAGNASAPVGGLDYAMNRGVVFSLTVSASQSKGKYKIANNASGFKETIAVQNMYGDALGSLTVGQTVNIGSSSYRLDLDSNNALSVTVAAAGLAPAKSDVDGNGRSDVMFVWTGEYGEGNYQHGYWLNGTSTWRSANASHPASWDNLGNYDMTGDGKADSVLFGNVDAYEVPSAYIGYYKDGVDTDDNWVTIGFLTNVAGIDWKNAVGNLTGNASGKNSIVWFAAELGALGAWTNGTDSWVSIKNGFDASWTLVGCGDFNGDGKDSVVMTQSGAQYCAVGIDGTWADLGASDSGWEVRAIGDFAGDGKDDIITFHKQTGIIAMWGNGSSSNWSQLGQLDAKDWFVVGAGDYDGDAKDDLLVRQNTTGMLGYYSGGDMSAWVEMGRGVDMNWTVIA